MTELESLLEDLRDLRDRLSDDIDQERGRLDEDDETEPATLVAALTSLDEGIDKLENYVNAA